MPTSPSITLYTGAVASGKTATLLAAATAARHAVVVLLPDRPQAAQVRVRTGNARHVFPAQFVGLAQRVIKRSGVTVPLLCTGYAQTLLLRAVVRDLQQHGQLPQFARVCDKPGWLAQVAAFIGEARNALIAPAALATAGITPYDSELGALYAAYEQALSRHGLTDPPGLLWAARAALPQLRRPLVRFLLVDGFDQFTPLQLAFLRDLAPHVGRMVISLSHEDGTRSVYHRFRQTAAALHATLSPTVQPHNASPNTTQHPWLHFCAAHIFAPPANVATPAPPPDDTLHIIRAADREREVRAVLRRVHRLRAEDGDETAPQEVAIVLRNPADYTPLLHEIASEYALPLAWHTAQPVSDTTVGVAYLRLLELLLHDTAWLQLAETWRAFDDGRLTPPHTLVAVCNDHALTFGRAAAAIHRLTRTLPPASGKRKLRALLAYYADPDNATTAMLSTADEDADDASEALLTANLSHREATRVLALFTAFDDWLSLPDVAPLDSYVNRMRDMLYALHPPLTTLAAAADAAAPAPDAPAPDARVAAILSVVNSMGEAADALYGSNVPTVPTVSRAAFVSDLLVLVQQCHYHLPVVADAVHVFDAFGARGQHFDHVLLLGLGENQFPRLPAAPLFHTRRERRLFGVQGLPLPVEDPRNEYALFFELIAGTRQSITVSYTYLDANGNTVEPSPFVVALGALVRDRERHTIRYPAGSSVATSAAVSTSEQLIGLLHAQPPTANTQPPLTQVAPSLHPLLHHIWRATSIEQYREGTADQPHGSYEGVITASDLHADLAARTDLAGAQRRWSYTSLNDYGICPFRFAAAHLLRLRALPGASDELESVGRGILLHAVMARAGERWRAAQLRLTPANEGAVLTELHAAADEAFAQIATHAAFTAGSFWEWEQRDVRLHLERSVRRLLHTLPSPEHYRIAAIERSFGSATGHTAPLRLTTSAGEVLVSGRIDRIDEHDDGSLLVLDYKSSSTPRSLSETVAGNDLQLALYILAAQQIFTQTVTGALFVHLGSGKTGTLLDGSALHDSVTAATAQVGVAVDRIRKGDLAVRPRDECPRGCQFAPICRLNKQKQNVV